MKENRPTVKPTIRQYQAWKFLLDQITRYVIYGGAAGGGKTWLGTEWFVSFSYMYPETRYFVGRNELKALRDSFIPTFKKVLKWHQIPEDDWKFNGNDNFFVNVVNGSRIDLLNLKYMPSDPLYERYGSIEYTDGWIEEGGEVHEAAFDTLKSRVGRQHNDTYDLKGKILVTCNPKKNWIYRDFYKPFSLGKLPADSQFVKALVTDNPFINADYIEALKSIKNQVKRSRLLLGEWEYENDPSALIEYDTILGIFGNESVYSGLSRRFISADIAAMGANTFVVVAYENYTIIDIAVMDKSRGNEVIKLINAVRIRNKVPPANVVFDADGVGAGVSGFLPGSTEFVNNSRALKYKGEQENYRNLKAQCYYHMAEAINAGLLTIKANISDEQRRMIIEELEQVKVRNPDGDGALDIVPKEDVKAAIGRSPDYSDAMAMRFIFDLDRGLLPKMM